MRRPVSFLYVLVSLALSMAGASHAATATLTVNAGTTLTTFKPINVFGNNTAYWISYTNNNNVQAQVQAAGNYFLRYPGGSSSDDFHWNSTGSFDSNQYWVPSNSSYTPGFADNEIYRGTTSSYGSASEITDGNTGSYWLSNIDTDFPNHQWVQLDLAASASVNSVTIVWGTPYATSFQIQYWPTSGWPPPLSSNKPESTWVTTSSGTLSSTGGTQQVTFTAVAAQYFRILMTASSAGAGGAYSIAEVTLYNGATQVSVNTNSSSSQTQVEVSSTDPASSKNYTTSPPWSTDFESFMTYIHKFSPAAVPMITVNFGTGTPAEAAAWVHYANIVKGYGIQYWQIGNETEGNWETGGPLPAQDYVRRYIEYYDAMKAEDPSIVITGPVTGGFNDNSNMYDGKGYLQDFINILAAKGKIDHLNAIDFHWYPNYGNYTAAQALASTSTLDAFPASLNSWLSSAGVASPGTVPVIMSEFNVDPGDMNFQVQLGNGLWVADALGHFILDFGSHGFSNLWDTLNGGSDQTSTTGGDLGYLNVAGGIYQYQAHASYWAMQMMATLWAMQGESRDHQLVSASSNQSLLVPYAVVRPDNLLALVVINKDPSNTYNGTINISGFTPNPSANYWTFDASNYQWLTTSTPYHASPDTAPSLHTGSVGSSFSYSFPPYSITLWQFTGWGTPTPSPSISPTPSTTFTPTISPTFSSSPSISPTFSFSNASTISPTFTISQTFSNSPSISPTPTISPTATPAPAVLMIDDFEDGNSIPLAPFNGAWYHSLGTGSTMTEVFNSAPGVMGSNYCLSASGTNNNNYAIVELNLFSTNSNFDASGFSGIQFWFKGDGNTYGFTVKTSNVTDYAYFGATFTAAAGVWTHIEIPFSSLVQPPWKTVAKPWDPSLVTGLQFASIQGGSYSFSIDNVNFYSPAGDLYLATQTPTPTLSPAASVPLSGPPSIFNFWVVPHPLPAGPGKILIQASGEVDQIELKIYTVNFVLAHDVLFNQPTLHGAYYALPVDTSGWPAGTYFLQVLASGAQGSSKKSKVLYLLSPSF